MLDTRVSSAILLLLGLLTPVVAQEAAPAKWQYDPALLRPFWEGDTVAGESLLFIRDDKTGEAVLAFVVPNGEVLTADEIKVFCKDKLTGYKSPKRIEFRKELPKTNVGKILRRELRDAAIKELTA